MRTTPETIPLVALLAAALTATSLFAQEPPAAPARDAAAEAPPPPAERTRDPFWPVGWRPPTFGAVEETAKPSPTDLIKWSEAVKQIRVSGLSNTSDGGFMAVIKGIGVVEEGDVIAVDYKGLTYRWKLRSITEAGIIPEKLEVFPTR